MPRPKLAVEEVFVLTHVFPYEGSEVEQVFVDADVAKASRPEVKRWYLQEDGSSWASANLQRSDYSDFWHIEKFPVRSK